MTKVSGDEQADSVRATLAEPLVVEVLDGEGEPVEGTAVEFRASHGGSIEDATTNAEGRVSASWVLGDSAGTQTAAVHVGDGGSAAVTFTAEASPGAAAALEVSGGDGQTGRTLQLLDEPVAVRVTDAYGNGVPSALVAFTATSGGGEFSPMRAATDAAGVAQAEWRLGDRSIQQTADAGVEGLDGVALTARVDSTRLVRVRAVSQDAASAGAALESVAPGDTVNIYLEAFLDGLAPETRGAIASRVTWQPVAALDAAFLSVRDAQEYGSAIEWDLRSSEDPRVVLATVVARSANTLSVESPAILVFTVPPGAPPGEVVVELRLDELVGAGTFTDLTDEVSVVSTTFTVE